MTAGENLSRVQFAMQLGEHSHMVTAHAEGEPWPVGHLSFASGGKGEISNVIVDEKYQHQGIASGMLQHARAQGHTVNHSPHRSPDGSGWARATQ